MRKNRHAFTLIELLVVIAIIAILIALLVPAVQKVRESAARTQCANGIKQVALAMHAYHDVHHTLPEGMSAAGWAYGTWPLLVMPYLEQEALAKMYLNYNNKGGGGENYYHANNRIAVTSKVIPAFLCPSDDIRNAGAWPNNDSNPNCSYHNYVANFGNTAAELVGSGPQMQAMATFNGATFQGAPFYCGNPQKLTNIVDGTSNTLLVSEIIVGQKRTTNDLRGMIWYGPGAFFETNLRPNDSGPDQFWSNTSWCDSTSTNPPCVPYTGTAKWMYAARSRHSAGVNAAMGDGTVRFISNAINLGVWQALGTARGAEPVGEF